jgi:hypothetical protein
MNFLRVDKTAAEEIAIVNIKKMFFLRDKRLKVDGALLIARRV